MFSIIEYFAGILCHYQSSRENIVIVNDLWVFKEFYAKKVIFSK